MFDAGTGKQQLLKLQLDSSGVWQHEVRVRVLRVLATSGVHRKRLSIAEQARVVDLQDPHGHAPGSCHHRNFSFGSGNKFFIWLGQLVQEWSIPAQLCMLAGLET